LSIGGGYDKHGPLDASPPFSSDGSGRRIDGFFLKLAIDNRQSSIDNSLFPAIDVCIFTVSAFTPVSAVGDNVGLIAMFTRELVDVRIAPRIGWDLLGR
jgi:hypothetical protein